MNMGGMGTLMMKSLMKKKNVASLEQFLEMSEELGVRIFVRFLEEAANSKVQLFI
jgi:peroxiredoxin family protein